MVNDTVLPNVVRFNVSVTHTASSTGDAHTVQILTGSQRMDVIFGDMIPPFNPSHPEITVTDKTIIQWDKDTLSRSGK